MIPDVPGTVVTRGRELLMLNLSHQWLAPGVLSPMPPPDKYDGWIVLRVGYEGKELPDEGASADDER